MKTQAGVLGLPYKITSCVEGMTWAGTDSSLSSVLLNSHTDVVPVFPEYWTYEPFSAFKDEAGNIYGRGTQDMKYDGIQKFVHPPEFKVLNIGFSLDEGLAGPDDEFPMYYGERNVFWVRIICHGNPGHGSRFLENTAGEKAQYVINKLFAFREAEKAKLLANPHYTLGDVTSVNLTIMEGGVQTNVVPDKFILNFDIRITPTTNIEEFEAMLRGWLAEAGQGIQLEFLQKFTDQTMTSISEDDPWYSALKTAFKTHKMKVRPQIFPAGTDSRYLRELGIPAIGFSPMNNTPILLHDHNEFLNETVFLKGIDIFEDIIENVANVEKF